MEVKPPEMLRTNPNKSQELEERIANNIAKSLININNPSKDPIYLRQIRYERLLGRADSSNSKLESELMEHKYEATGSSPVGLIPLLATVPTRDQKQNGLQF